MAQRVLLIINPKAGKARGKQALFPIVDQFCRHDALVTTYITAARGEAESVTVSQAPEHDLVVCCGGDGTLGEVINGLLRCEKRVPLGYIPLGSTNDFANSMGLSHRIPEAAKTAIEGADTSLDVGRFNGERYFSYIASFGAFTAASYKAPQETKNALGHFAYILEGAKEFAAIRPYEVTVETGDKTVTGEFLFGAVCNSTSVAGLVKLNSDLVDMGDGLFEVILVRPPRNAADMGKLLNSINTGVFDKKLFEVFKTAHVTFTIKDAPPWSLDGDQAEGAETVTIENCHSALLFRK